MNLASRISHLHNSCCNIHLISRKSSEMIEKESGIKLHSPPVAALVQGILNGNWSLVRISFSFHSIFTELVAIRMC